MSAPVGRRPEDSEQRGVDEVVERLSEKYPGVGAGLIREIVDEEHRLFDGRPIRDFVPVLVEKRAKARVKELAGDR